MTGYIPIEDLMGVPRKTTVQQIHVPLPTPSVFTQPTAEVKANTFTQSSDVIERAGINNGLFKAYIPEILYKPPYGFPRMENIPLLKTLGRSAYVFGVISMLAEEAASNGWEIIPVDDSVEMTPQLEEKKKQIMDFLRNPNGNQEGFSTLVKAAVRDICEVDAGVWVKVFTPTGEMVQLFARDGGYFLKNPDQYGYMGERDDIVIVPQSLIDSLSKQNDNAQVNATLNASQVPPDANGGQITNMFDTIYKEKAAYFQYGFTNSRYPVPFGKREVVYFMKNPRSDGVYGISPVAVLADIIVTLIFGSQYNLDFYMNSNMPEGMIGLPGADAQTIRGFKERFETQFIAKDPATGFNRKIGYKMPVTNVLPAFVPFQLSAREMQIIEQQTWFSKIVWQCFGVAADDMGFNEDSNKAVSQTNQKRYAKKAVRPILQLIAERINMQIIPEFDTTDLMFRFEDYDLDEDIKRMTLYQMQINMGIKTPEMVAAEEKIDLDELRESKEEKNKQDQAAQQAQGFDISDPNANAGNDKKAAAKESSKDTSTKDAQDDKKAEAKSEIADPFANTELEEDLVEQITKGFRKVYSLLREERETITDHVEESRTQE